MASEQKWLNKYIYLLYIDIGEGNGNPLQYSCLENSINRGAWQATVHGVSKSQIWLSMPEAERTFAQLKRLTTWSLRIWILSVKRIFFKNLITCRDFQKNHLLNWPKWSFPCLACTCYFLPTRCRSSWQADFSLKLVFIMLETTSLRLSVLWTSEKALQGTGKKLPSYAARSALF